MPDRPIRAYEVRSLVLYGNPHVRWKSGNFPLCIEDACRLLGWEAGRVVESVKQSIIPGYVLGDGLEMLHFRYEDILAYQARSAASGTAGTAGAEAGRGPRPARLGWIYFLGAAEVGRIKIGYSADPHLRGETMLVGCPVDVELIGVFRGNKSVEQGRIHRGFSALRWKREWFRDDPRLRAFIRDFAGPPSDAERPADAGMSGEEIAAYLRDLADRVGRWFSANP